MKRLSFIAILGLLLFASCENRNGGEQTFQSIKCHPSLSWLEKFLPMPDVGPGGPKKLVPPEPDPIEEYYDAYQYSHFLRVTVPDANTLKFMHHTEFPCAYSVKGHVDLQNNKIVLREELIKPVTIDPIPPCLCGATISSSATVSHLDYDTIELEGLSLPIHLYEGLDTLIMIYTDVPEEPETMLLLEGKVVNENDHGLPDVKVILENQTGTLSKTIYTSESGYFFEHLTFDISKSDTLSVIALDPYYNYYDTTKVAFADMYIDYDAWTILYLTDVKIQLGKK
jgi:hypothetical protein